jgi:hypothetical protein
MTTQSEHDDNYFHGIISGGNEEPGDTDMVLDGGGADLPADAPLIAGGNAGTRHLADSKLSKTDGFGFPKGLPTSIKLTLHRLLDEQGVTLETLAASAQHLASQLKPLLEQRYDFVVNHTEALVEQVKTDAAKFLATKS